MLAIGESVMQLLGSGLRVGSHQWRKGRERFGKAMVAEVVSPRVNGRGLPMIGALLVIYGETLVVR